MGDLIIFPGYVGIGTEIARIPLHRVHQLRQRNGCNCWNLRTEDREDGKGSAEYIKECLEMRKRVFDDT